MGSVKFTTVKGLEKNDFICGCWDKLQQSFQKSIYSMKIKNT